MSHSLVLWTASLLSQAAAGQVIQQATPVEAGCNCASGGQVSRGGRFLDRFRVGRSYEEGTTYRSSGLFARFQDRWSPGRTSNEPVFANEGSSHSIGAPVSEPATEFLQRMPNKISFNEPPLVETKQAVATQTNESGVASVSFRPAGTASNHVIHAKFVDKVGHEEDYSWITGQLGQEGNRWVIYFATAETVDRYNGKLVLAGSADMNSFKIGDLVSIQGGVIQRGGSQGNAYLIQSINLIENK